MSVITFLGRILIAIAIISTAYQHVTNPADNLTLFKHNYTQVFKFAQNFAPGLLPEN